jgi:hypothetical protein
MEYYLDTFWFLSLCWNSCTSLDIKKNWKKLFAVVLLENKLPKKLSDFKSCMTFFLKNFAKSRPTCHPHAIIAPSTRRRKRRKGSFPVPARSSSCFLLFPLPHPRLSANTTASSTSFFRVPPQASPPEQRSPSVRRGVGGFFALSGPRGT